MGIETRDDAAVYRIGDDVALVQTVDFFPPIVDDPYAFGAIAVANSLSDIYAMGGKPITALNILCYPVDLDRDPLEQILRGGYDKAKEAGVLIVGGHTLDDAEPKYGLAVTGTVRPGAQVTNAGAKPGDILVLTKPIGTGIITTAAKKGVAEPGVLEGAIDQMMALNRPASEAMLEVGVDACTDVTGFGLIGHLASMCAGSNVGAQISLSDVPVLPGTRSLVSTGIAIPEGTYRNLHSVKAKVRWPELTQEARILLCDAQTSGGLLLAVSPDRLGALLQSLERYGVPTRNVIGSIVKDPEHYITVRL